MYLLDTNVVSELRKPKPHGAVIAWIQSIPDDQLSEAYEIIPIDAGMFREWARLMEGRSDHLIEDAIIAATARIRGLIVATRNVRDFRGLAVEVFNPFTPKT